VQQRQQQYAHQQFQQMQAQQRYQMQSWASLNQQQAQVRWQQMARQQQLRLYSQTSQQIAEDQALQQKAEQQANEQLARLAQEQQRKQIEHPALDAQQTIAQQREDAKQLKLLAVRNYQTIFLPGQVAAALQSQLPSAKVQQDVRDLTQELLSNAWWKQQTHRSVLSEKLGAHRTTLTALLHELKGSQSTASSSTPLATDRVNALFTADKFDPQAANQLLREAAQADKHANSLVVTEAIEQLILTTTQLETSPQGQTNDQKVLRKQVQTSVKRVYQELARYQAHVGSAGQLFQMQRTIAQTTAGYLAQK
jgi:NADH dehydrogenase/NADH:ubiquinone oxidoreductase subunit G